jgi:hypothetical protein
MRRDGWTGWPGRRTLAVGLIPANPALAAASVLVAGLVLGQLLFLLAIRA